MDKLFEQKSFNFEIKASDDDEMTFEGYGSIFGNLDSYRDVVEKGAFTRTINNNKNRIKILWQHDTWQPIGKPIDIYEDEKGLFLKGKISATEKGKEAYILMKDKVINEMSIGYNTVKYEYDKEKDIRYLKEIKLYEVSLVSYAANDKARVSNVKFESFITELKNGNLLRNISKDKVEEAIKALMALIEPEKIDSSQDTQSKQDNPPAINKIDESVIKESEIIQELINRWN